MKEKNSVTKNTLYNIFTKVLRIIFPLLTIPYISRVLGPGNLGKVNFIRSIVLYFTVIAWIGIPFYGNREISKNEENGKLRNKTFLEIESLHIFTVFIVQIIFIILIFQFPQIIKGNIKLGVILGGLIFSSLFNIDWFFRGMGRFDVISKLYIYSRIIYVILIFVFLKNETDLYNYAFIIICCDFIFNLMMFYKSRHLLNLSEFNIKSLDLTTHFKYVSWFFFAQIAKLVYTELDSVMIGYIQNEEQVGHYYVANKLVKSVLPVITSASAVLIGKISQLKEKGEFENIINYLNRSVSLMFLIAVPAAMGLILLSNEIITLVFGIQYNSALTLKILAPLLIVIGLNNIYGMQILLAFNREKEFSLIIIIASITNFCLNLFLINRLGFNGAAIATLIAEIIIVIAEYILIKSSFSRIHNKKGIVKIGISTLVMIIYIINVKTWLFSIFNSILAMVVIISTSCFIYLMLLLLLKNKILKWLIHNKVIPIIFNKK